MTITLARSTRRRDPGRSDGSVPGVRFTLAGAVIVSGIVALTLSPMMGSKLLRAGDTSEVAGWINRRFDGS